MILKVSEAQTKDVGRGIARIDPDNFKELKADVGDVIEISSTKPKARKKSVAKLMPTYPDDRGQGIIQIDGIIRENTGVGLDEKVKVQKISHKEAEQVILLPLTISSSLKQTEDKEYIAKLLDGTPIIKNDKLRITFFGSRFQEFQVVDTDPSGVVLIRPETLIKIKGQAKEGEKKIGITYEDIGGLKKEIQRIREMIELPLKYPEVFERLGIDPPKGVLLYGPPGCGKTLIAKAVVNETDANFYHISGPEIIGKFYGESEGRLREIFEEAERNAPAILFIDEIDAIAPKREDMGGEKQVERRVVAQLLALMDGLESRGQLVVIGATNIPNTLDPALRRPGRFDREIAISIPDKNGRKEILEIHTRGMPLSEDVNVEKLAEITHGFVGADLEALSREAAMAALREIMPEIEFEKEYIPYKKLSELEVTMDHFREALKEVEPSALREVFIETPDTSWEDVGGLNTIKETLREAIEWPLKYNELFNYAHTRPPKGILLYGPPGCGKTLIAKAVSHESGVNFISVKGPALLSKYIGESERAVREVFKKAKMSSPCIVFFDELDALTPKRSGTTTDSHVTERVVSQFLAEMDGIEELKGVVILGATNRRDLIDSALLRPGRFDFLIEIPKPDEKARFEIFKIHTRKKPLAPEVNLKKLARDTKDLMGSDIEFICRNAAMTAIKEFLASKAASRRNKDLEKFFIKTKHFEIQLKNDRNRTKSL
ncbi:CDC48 family AAA ATPase [Patescibacteria group bacterium]|nr:CDC48 family AAA ATPase [Patescibacteria group bacterium]